MFARRDIPINYISTELISAAVGKHSLYQWHIRFRHQNIDVEHTFPLGGFLGQNVAGM